MQVAAGRCDDLASIQARIEEVVIKSVIYTVSTQYLHSIYTLSTGRDQERPLRPRLHPQRAEAGQEEGDEVHLQLLQTVRVRRPRKPPHFLVNPSQCCPQVRHHAGLPVPAQADRNQLPACSAQ